MNEILSEFSLQINNYELLIALLLAVFFGVILNLLVSKFSNLLHSKGEYFFIFPVLIAVMVLVITIIKTSLALSLGLVGALSIVRFRTPVKEPEELIYIFFAIAIGLGLGAGQILSTSLSFFIISGFIISIKLIYKQKIEKSIFFEITLPKEKFEENLDTITSVLDSRNLAYNLSRINTNLDISNVIFHLFSGNNEIMKSLIKDVSSAIPEAKMLIIDNPKIGI